MYPVSPKAVFSELKIRLDPGELHLKRSFQAAADARRMSLNQWLIAAAVTAAEAQGVPVDKPRRGR